MLVVGLTGGIGAGKSCVLQCFKSLGIDVFDTDQVARQLVQSGLPAFKAIVKHFGKHIVAANGELDRSLLRQLIFENTAEREWLEQLLHPLIYKNLSEQLCLATSAYAVIEIPLLMEHPQPSFIDRVLLVVSSESERIARIRRRDGLRMDEIRSVMAQQMPAEKRLQMADDVLHNDQDISQLQLQVDRLHSFYLQLAGSHI
ncbi:MAG: dephospho-CoA kinase [gamma proteobacterium symbiont of Bathyaustriella thionipta]|nr:dephospho-CoA kinase [gamma proteobacterium symbiont of Bathyaustriella thionipta]